MLLLIDNHLYFWHITACLSTDWITAHVHIQMKKNLLVLTSVLISLFLVIVGKKILPSFQLRKVSRLDAEQVVF